MNAFHKLRAFIKKKLPATFNAAEYETDRVISRIAQNEELLLQLKNQHDELIELIHTQNRSQGQINDFCSQFSDVKDEIIKLTLNYEKKHMELLSHVQDLEKKCDDVVLSNDKSNSEIKPALLQILDADTEHYNEMRDSIDKLFETVAHFDLRAAASCTSDEDYDRQLIPINRYFGNRGMAISMHFKSIAEKPDPIVYETSDIIRTSALSLVADEIHARKLGGAVAELGVAQGKFARVINALFPEKTLHLFDTFEGFPEVDINVDKESNYSNATVKSYANIDMSALMSSIRYPEKCVIHKGYFPDTAEGLEEQFCFVNIDCDLYVPIKAGLEYFYPRLLKGGCIFVHDYRSKYYKGVKVAVNEFAEKYGVSYCVLPDNTGTAVIMK